MNIKKAIEAMRAARAILKEALDESYLDQHSQWCGGCEACPVPIEMWSLDNALTGIVREQTRLEGEVAKTDCCSIHDDCRKYPKIGAACLAAAKG